MPGKVSAAKAKVRSRIKGEFIKSLDRGHAKGQQAVKCESGSRSATIILDGEGAQMSDKEPDDSCSLSGSERDIGRRTSMPVEELLRGVAPLGNKIQGVHTSVAINSHTRATIYAHARTHSPRNTLNSFAKIAPRMFAYTTQICFEYQSGRANIEQEKGKLDTIARPSAQTS